MTDTVTIAVCDDEQLQCAWLRKAAGAWAERRGLGAAVEEFSGAEEFFREWRGGKKFDVLLLDIMMGGEDGMALARKIRREDDRMVIIFITAFEGYAREGYEVQALQYLLKPVDEEKLFQALDRARSLRAKPQEAMLIETGDGQVRLALNDILYAESFGHRLEIHCRDGVYETAMKMAGFEAAAGDAFFRCHRSCAVNLKFVKRIAKTSLTLDNGALIPVSRRVYAELNRAFIRYYAAGEEP